MLIGLESFTGMFFDTPQTPISNISYLSIKECIADDLHIRNTLANITEKSEWDNSTVLYAAFSGDMEAGNISMRENQIAKLRLKRKEGNESYFKTIAEFDFDNQIITKTYSYNDYEAMGNVEITYMVCPVDSAGIEGKGTVVTTLLDFSGWWIIDMESPDENSVQFIYNMDSVSISTEQDRTILKTFSKYPFVRYGATHCKQGSLKSMNVNFSVPIWKQVQKLDNMCQMHKSFLLKDGNGHRYIVDINSPTETTYEHIKDASDLTVEWYQVGQVGDKI